MEECIHGSADSQSNCILKDYEAFGVKVKKSDTLWADVENRPAVDNHLSVDCCMFIVV